VDYGVEAGEETEAVPAPAKKWKPLYSHLVFREGDMGGGTREIQTGLNRLGYGLNVDGEFGPLTEDAVMQFQITQGLEADGVVGKKTWAALIEAVNA
jgi:peptidoglycan hydrolase-like protein with peptidoglycan-binding domain